MKNDKILKEIDRLRGVTEKKLEISREAWLDQLWKIAFANITHVVEWDKKGRARYKSSDEIDGTLLKEFSETIGMNGVTKTLKLKDSMKAFELIGKAQGYFEKSKGDGNGNGLLEALVQAVQQSAERLDGGDEEDGD